MSGDIFADISALETGIDLVDDQHRHLLGLLGAFTAAMEENMEVLLSDSK